MKFVACLILLVACGSQTEPAEPTAKEPAATRAVDPAPANPSTSTSSEDRTAKSPPSPRIQPIVPRDAPPARVAACAKGTPSVDGSWTGCSGGAAVIDGKTMCFQNHEDGCMCKCGTKECNVAESFPPQLFCAR